MSHVSLIMHRSAQRSGGSCAVPPAVVGRGRRQPHPQPLLFAHPVQQAWGRVQDGMGAAEAVDMTGWGAAGLGGGTAHGRVIVRAGGGAGGPQNRPANGTMVPARQHATPSGRRNRCTGQGPPPPELLARHTVWPSRQPRPALRRTRSLHEDLYAHPHRFWRAFKARAAQAPPGFSKAYDTVDRRLLWRCLEGMGVHGPALQVLQNMYEDVQLRVRVGGAWGCRSTRR